MSTCKLNQLFNLSYIPYRYIKVDLTECALFSKLFSKEIREHEVQGIVINVDQMVKNCLSAAKKLNEFKND